MFYTITLLKYIQIWLKCRSVIFYCLEEGIGLDNSYLDENPTIKDFILVN